MGRISRGHSSYQKVPREYGLPLSILYHGAVAACQMGGSVNFSVKSWLVSVVSFARHTASLKLYNSVVG